MSAPRLNHPRLTPQQRALVDAIRIGRHQAFHRSVTRSLEAAGIIFQVRGNFMVGCGSHLAGDFILIDPGQGELFSPSS